MQAQIPATHAAACLIAGMAACQISVQAALNAVSPLPPPIVRTAVYDCDNLSAAPQPDDYPPDHPARYAVIRLQNACREQRTAVVLATVWQHDPLAGSPY